MPYTQDARTIQVATPLGKDVLLLNEATIEERVSAPFRMHLELLSEEPSVDFAQLVGKPMGVMMVSLHGERYFHGIVRRFRQKAPDAGLYAYEAELVPWLWLLTQTRNCRVFTAKSVPAIIEQVFSDHGMQDYQLKLEGSYSERVYCVQYRESDFAFVTRLMEEEGIHYWFRHEQDKHVLVLADASGNAAAIAGKSPEIKFMAAPGGTQPDEVVVSFDKEMSVCPAKVVLDDYDYQNPTFDLLKTSGDEGFEVYDYPGGYTQGADGEHFAGVRLEELKARGTTFNGHSNRRHMAPGALFDLKEHANEGFNASYFVVAVYHAASVAGSYGGGGTSTVQESYSNAFEAIPKDTPFRPERSTPKPLVQGSQTAMVVGPSGEEIHTDSLGRVCVQFPWDRVAAADGESVCWVRVAHGAAGKNWGQLFIPRVGQEVVVDFMEGDPDRPLVTGVVYHAEAMPPLDLPDEKTRSGIKTRSTPQGDATAFNQLRFEDKQDEEQVFLQAQKNLDVRVKNDAKSWVGNDQHEVVGNDDYSHVVNDRHVTVDNKLTETVGGDRHRGVTGEEAVEVGGNMSVTVGGDHVLEASGLCGWTSGDKITLTAGEIVLEADSKVTIKVGGSELVVDSSGVTATGSEVVLDASTAKIASGSGASGGSGDTGSATLPDQAAEALEADESNEAGTGSAAANEAGRGLGESGSVAGASWDAPKPGAEEEPEPKSFVSFLLKDEDDAPLPREPYRITCADGSVLEGRTDEAGRVHVDGVSEGSCEISFPRLDGDEVTAD